MSISTTASRLYSPKFQSRVDLHLIKIINSSPYFVQYLGKILPAKQQNSKYFIVFKPINIANPFLSAYNFIRWFIHCMPSIQEFKRRRQPMTKDVVYLLKQFYTILKQQLNSSQKRQLDRNLGKEIFQNQISMIYTNPDFKAMINHFKLVQQNNLPDTPYWKMFQSPYYQAQQIIQQEKQSLNQYYSQYFRQIFKKIQIKLSRLKCQDLRQLQKRLKQVFILQGSSSYYKEIFIVQQLPYKNLSQEIQQGNRQNQHNQIIEFMKKEKSLLDLSVQNTISNVNKTLSQTKRLGAYLIQKLIGYSKKGIVYPLHPKYIIYHPDKQQYRLSLQPLLLQCLGLKKQPKDFIALLINARCNPVQDVYNIIDKYFQMSYQERLKYESLNQEKICIGRSKDFINIVKIVFILSQFRRRNLKLLAKILNAQTYEQKFILIGEFIKSIFRNPFDNSNIQQKKVQQQDIQCEITIYYFIQEIIEQMIQRKFKEIEQEMRKKQTKNVKGDKKTQQQIKCHECFRLVQIQLQEFSLNFQLKDFIYDKTIVKFQEDLTFLYLHQYKKHLESSTISIQAWLSSQLQQLSDLQQLPHQEQKSLRSKHYFALILFYAKYLLYHSYFINLQIFLLNYNMQEVYIRKLRDVRNMRQEAYFNRDQKMKKVLQKIKQIENKMRSQQELQKFKQIREFIINNLDKKIYSINNRNFWTDEFLNFSRQNHQKEFGQFSQAMLNFKQNFNYQQKSTQLNTVLQKMFTTLMSLYQMLMNQYFRYFKEFNYQHKYIQIYFYLYFRFSPQSLSQFSDGIQTLQQYRSDCKQLKKYKRQPELEHVYIKLQKLHSLLYTIGDFQIGGKYTKKDERDNLIIQ